MISISTSIEYYKEVHGPHIPTTHPGGPIQGDPSRGFVDQAGPIISRALRDTRDNNLSHNWTPLKEILYFRTPLSPKRP